MLGLFLLVVLAAMAVYEPWSLLPLAPSTWSQHTGGTSADRQAPNDWHRLFLSTLYRLGGGEESHPA